MMMTRRLPVSLGKGADFWSESKLTPDVRALWWMRRMGGYD